MMSCYVGLLELYKVTGDLTYLNAVEMTVNDIIQNEINIVGGASATEGWFGNKNQTTSSFLSMETCVTFTWMQLCDRLYQITKKSKYADQIEKATYNALQAAMRANNAEFASYIPLKGFRRVGEEQCGMDINCCKANGPRAFTMLPNFALQVYDNVIDINLYTDFKANVVLEGGKDVDVMVNTSYPLSDKIEIEVSPKKASDFTVALRIPIWSKKNSLSINGVIEESEMILAGSNHLISRNWKRGDKITLTLDLRARMVSTDNHVAIVRGPIVLSRDSRFLDGFVDEAVVVEHDKDGIVPLSIVDSENNFAWMSFSVNAVTSIYNGDKKSFRKIHLCDFGSAGNTWDEEERYNVWLPWTIETADRDTWW